MAVGYGPYTARGETHWITIAYIVLQLQIFFQGQIVLYRVELIGADPLWMHTLNLILLSTTKPWILLRFPNEISSPIPTRPHHIYGHPTFPATSHHLQFPPIPLPTVSPASSVSCTVSCSSILHSLTHLSCSSPITRIVSFRIAYSLLSSMQKTTDAVASPDPQGYHLVQTASTKQSI